jgi:hypothetical protein
VGHDETYAPDSVSVTLIRSWWFHLKPPPDAFMKSPSPTTNSKGRAGGISDASDVSTTRTGVEGDEKSYRARLG